MASKGHIQNDKTSKSHRSSGKEKKGHDSKLSRILSCTLRHKAQQQNISMDSGGFVKVQDLLKNQLYKRFTLDDIQEVVVNNDKKRFTLIEKDGQLWIRANQGHSIDLPDLELTEVGIDEIAGDVIHGTFESAVELIRKNGLSRMARAYIHMATSLPGLGETISGMRKSCDYIVYVNINKALQDGFKFYRSSNGVILCAGDDQGFIPPKYLRIKPRS